MFSKKQHKFKLGDIVKHKASSKHNAKRLLVIAYGEMISSSGTEFIYHVSAEKENFVSRDDSFFRSTLLEDELELYS